MKERVSLTVFSIVLVGSLVLGVSLLPLASAQQDLTPRQRRGNSNSNNTQANNGRADNGQANSGQGNNGQANSGRNSTTQQIIEGAGFIIRNWNALGCGVSETLGTVTNIKEVRNETREAVLLWKVDGAEQSWPVPANTTRTGDFWIPWANNEQDYRNHRMTISVGNRRDFIHIWQTGPSVRFSADEEYVPASEAASVPGVDKSGGDRILIIRTERGGPTFAFDRKNCPQVQ